MARPESSDPTRWTNDKKDSVLMEILDGKLSVNAACRRYDVSQSLLESWIEQRLEAGSPQLLAVWMLRASFATTRDRAPRTN